MQDRTVRRFVATVAGRVTPGRQAFTRKTRRWSHLARSQLGCSIPESEGLLSASAFHSACLASLGVTLRAWQLQRDSRSPGLCQENSTVEPFHQIPVGLQHSRESGAALGHACIVRLPGLQLHSSDLHLARVSGPGSSLHPCSPHQGRVSGLASSFLPTRGYSVPLRVIVVPHRRHSTGDSSAFHNACLA
jgi:hypothetical protein